MNAFEDGVVRRNGSSSVARERLSLGVQGIVAAEEWHRRHVPRALAITGAGLLPALRGNEALGGERLRL